MSGLLKFVLSRPVEAMLNRFLQRDTTLLQQLFRAAPHKVLALSCTSQPGFALALRIDETRLTLISQPEGPVDIEISGSRIALLNLLTQSDTSAALYHPELQLRGDIHLLQKIHQQVSRLELDWADFFAHTGTQLGADAISSAGNLARAQVRSLQQDTRDFLQEEAALLPNRQEVMLFEQRLAQLRQRIDRAQTAVRLLT